MKSILPTAGTFADGVANQEVLDASLESAKSRKWVSVEHSQKFTRDTVKLTPVGQKNAGL